MKNIPEIYEVNQKAFIKDFIPQKLKVTDREKLRKYVKVVTLKYQIYGENLLSVIDEKYNVSNIQIVEIEVEDIKNAVYIANIFQEEINKNLCIVKLFDETKEIYSFAQKRLNQNNREEIVVTDKFLTNIFDKRIESEDKKIVEEILDFNKVLNKTNKVNFYSEIFIKNYIIKNQKCYKNSLKFLEMPIWYDEKQMNEFFEIFKNLVQLKEKVTKTVITREKIEMNKKIKILIDQLSKLEEKYGN